MPWRLPGFDVEGVRYLAHGQRCPGPMHVSGDAQAAHQPLDMAGHLLELQAGR